MSVLKDILCTLDRSKSLLEIQHMLRTGIFPPSTLLGVKGTVIQRMDMVSAPRESHRLVGGTRQLYKACGE